MLYPPELQGQAFFLAISATCTTNLGYCIDNQLSTNFLSLESAASAVLDLLIESPPINVNSLAKALWRNDTTLEQATNCVLALAEIQGCVGD